MTSNLPEEILNPATSVVQQNLPKTILPGSPSLVINQGLNSGYTTILEKRLHDLRSNISNPVSKTIRTDLPKQSETLAETLQFTPPQIRDTQETTSAATNHTLFSLPLPTEPLGIINPLQKQADINQLPNLNQFQSLTSKPAEIIRQTVQNNIVPVPKIITSQPISKPTNKVHAAEITIEDLKTIKLPTSKNGAVNNIVYFQRRLQMARSE
jgi:hypothetical protein